uniref:Uncharacterized protein n=1 Tax=Rhizophora mucronata TaxID=61149 RepID=A0A2P2NWH8_RHIMU
MNIHVCFYLIIVHTIMQHTPSWDKSKISPEPFLIFSMWSYYFLLLSNESGTSFFIPFESIFGWNLVNPLKKKGI